MVAGTPPDEPGEGGLGQIALAHRQPLVVLLGEERSAEPGERLALGKDADDVLSPSDPSR